MLRTGTPCLEIEGLVKDVGPVPGLDGRMKRVLAGVDLTARHGEVTVILGVNGAGKTTTLECAQGLQRRQGGSIRLLGHDPEHADAELRSRVGVMLQDGGLPPSARPLQLLKHVAGFYSNPRPVTELAGRLGIDAFSTTSIRRLSGGQKQRVALAAALIGRPEMVFLDEPSAGLDPQSRQVVFELISELRDEGLGIVLTTHLLDDAERLADQVYILDDGRTLSHGTVPELLEGHTGSSPRRRIVLRANAGLRLHEAFPDPDTPAVLSVTEPAPGEYLIEGRVGTAELLALATWLHNQGVVPTSLEFGSRSLEDVFLTIAQEGTV